MDSEFQRGEGGEKKVGSVEDLRESWGLAPNSELRSGTKQLLDEALRILREKADSSIDDGVARIASRVVNVTAKELEVDFYRAYNEPLRDKNEKVVTDVDFDPKKDDTDGIEPLREQNILLEVNFSEVHFPDSESAKEDREDLPSESSLNEDVLADLLPQERLVDVERAIEKLGMTADAVVEIARNPAKEGTDIDVLRQLVIIAPTEEEEIALKRMNLRGKDATREFMWRMAEVPSVRKRIEAGITMKVFKIHTKEAMDVLDKYCKIAQEIVDSEKLATTLQMTLLLFNRVLLGDDEEEAKGFCLDVLPSLKKEANPVDESKTLLATLVRSLLSASPGTLPVDDMPILGSEMISLPVLDDVEEVVVNLYCSLELVAELCEGSDGTDPFLMAASKYLSGRRGAKKLQSTLASKHGLLRMSLQSMMSFFGEENINSRTRQMHIIRTIWEFTRDLDSAVMRAKVSDLAVRLARAK